jgi:hypothetical protein
VIIDHYRARRPSTPLDDDPTRIADTVIAPFPDDPETARRELTHCLRSMIDQLDEPYRSAVAAVDLDGATNAAAAACTGLSVPGVKIPCTARPTPTTPTTHQLLRNPDRRRRRSHRLHPAAGLHRLRIATIQHAIRSRSLLS